MAVEPVPYDPNWPRTFGAERDRVEVAVGGWVEAVEHVGSTAVPGLDAKPVVDLFAGVRNLGDTNRCKRPLEEIGYECRGEAVFPAGSSSARFEMDTAPSTCT